MRKVNLKRLVGISVLSMLAILGTGTVANAQGWYGNQRVTRKQQKQYEREMRARARQQELIRRQQARLARQNVYGNNGVGYAYGNRYRVYRNGSYYNTDSRGADLLRAAVNNGYRQGYESGRLDRSNRRGIQWSRNNEYRTGNYGYQSYVDRSQYQYYFQQGFQKGYQDGYYSRNQYGTYNNGSGSILASILGTILNIRSY